MVEKLHEVKCSRNPWDQHGACDGQTSFSEEIKPLAVWLAGWLWRPVSLQVHSLACCPNVVLQGAQDIAQPSDICGSLEADSLTLTTLIHRQDLRNLAGQKIHQSAHE